MTGIREWLKGQRAVYAIVAPVLARVRRLARPGSFSIRYTRRSRRAKTALLAEIKQRELRMVDLGGGSRPMAGAVLNIDGLAVAGVDVVGDLARLPLEDNSVGAIWMQGVIEHLREPEAVAAELARVLQPGGVIYADVVFLARYHDAPGDYQRLTEPGLRRLFAAFGVRETGMLCGPGSTLCDALRHGLALVLSGGSAGLFHVWYYYVLGYLTWPVKFFDVLLENHPDAARTAYAYYLIAEKPPGNKNDR